MNIAKKMQEKIRKMSVHATDGYGCLWCPTKQIFVQHGYLTEGNPCPACQRELYLSTQIRTVFINGTHSKPVRYSVFLN